MSPPVLPPPRIPLVPYVDEQDAWAQWQARIDAARAARQGPPSPREIALARSGEAAERATTGRLRPRVCIW